MVLTCTATGIPQPTISWLKDSGAITHDLVKFNISSDGMTLTILNMTYLDSGRYSCSAQNEAGIDSRQFSLSVIGKYLIRELFMLTNIFNVALQ